MLSLWNNLNRVDDHITVCLSVADRHGAGLFEPVRADRLKVAAETDVEAEANVAESVLLFLEVERLRDIRLQLGAVGQLLLAGEALEVLPLDDAELQAAADPVKADGSVRFDQAANDRRERAMVKRLLKAGPVAIVILGRDHDLGDEIRAADGRAVYRRVEAE